MTRSTPSTILTTSICPSSNPGAPARRPRVPRFLRGEADVGRNATEPLAVRRSRVAKASNRPISSGVTIEAPACPSSPKSRHSRRPAPNPSSLQLRPVSHGDKRYPARCPDSKHRALNRLFVAVRPARGRQRFIEEVRATNPRLSVASAHDYRKPRPRTMDRQWRKQHVNGTKMHAAARALPRPGRLGGARRSPDDGFRAGALGRAFRGG